MLAPHQLNYHHLRYFWEVGRQGSLRIAAEILAVSQPTISAQIKSLEEALECQLFSRSGRGLKLTRQGRLVMDFASDIFGMGSRMLDALHGDEAQPATRLSIGITDSFAKLLAWSLVKPALEQGPRLFVQCAEGKTADLLGHLASGKLDMVLADEPASPTLPIKMFSHLLGETDVVFCATASVAGPLLGAFPQSLDGARLLLPTAQSAWRNQLDHWFSINQIRPQVVAEFDDSSLMKIAAADGLGVVPILVPMLREAAEWYGLVEIGRAKHCHYPSYLITAERALKSISVRAMVKEAKKLFHTLGSSLPTIGHCTGETLPNSN